MCFYDNFFAKFASNFSEKYSIFVTYGLFNKKELTNKPHPFNKVKKCY